MRKRTRNTLVVLAFALLLLAVLVYLRTLAPPENARLLPESEAIVYLNLKPLRAATHFDRTSVVRSASYQHFIDATGIVAERDLDSAAFALHARPDPQGPNGPIAFSEVLEGRFDNLKLAGYLASLAEAQEQYAGHTVYCIPSQGRTVRVTILNMDTVAASNMPTPEQIHSILDRSRAAAGPFAGSTLLNHSYRDVPAFSEAWAIGRLGALSNHGGQVEILGLQLPIPSSATLIASLRYAGSLDLRIEEVAATPTEAQQTAEALNQLLLLTRAFQQAQQPVTRTPEDQATREFLNSVRITAKAERAVLTAKVSADTLKHLPAIQ